ncbi:MAG: enoyl-CoA hydratase/isomerase family protein [Prolixibacteraceae bacterium]|nr:enoyl-CoA hydratase/isomerase family protein [Burkholderiales bacterium]
MNLVMLQTEIKDGVATIRMNRPEVHNAFDDALIAALTAELRRLDKLLEARVIVLAANGKSFSAGADLNWMRRMAKYSKEENFRDAKALAGLMRMLDGLNKPTVARVQGAAFGGGVGLVACCDIAIASKEAAFSLSEVRLGLIPSVISPYVIAAIGEREARRYFLTAERFDAVEARRIGLVHDVVDSGALEEAVARISEQLLKGGPHALAAAKKLIADVSRRPMDDALSTETARRIAAIRVESEGQEGLAAFFEKRPPAWTKKS